MGEIQYSPDKPKDCKYCYWYEKRKGCTFGEHCYYEVKPETKKSPCDGCSYAVPVPCIGYCMIDSIINNGDRRKEQKQDKKPSILEKLQEKKEEAARLHEEAAKQPRKRSQDLDLS